MMPLKILYLIVFCFFISIGQILFKYAAIENKRSGSLFDLFTNGYFYAGILDYGLCTLFWIWILKDVPLNIAYPYVSFVFVFVPIMSWLFLGEPFGGKAIIGTILIVVGVAIVSN